MALLPGIMHDKKQPGAHPGTHISGRPWVLDHDFVSADCRPPAAIVQRNTKLD
ncbi:MAG TPA: hypothetical protein VKA08_19875 [Balneolales bacterium]|nr:hypothetical protein [Balneolales bacterium]